MSEPHAELAVGVDVNGFIWMYQFLSFDEALEFVHAVEEDGWHWEVRSTGMETSVADAVVHFKDEAAQYRR